MAMRSQSSRQLREEGLYNFSEEQIRRYSRHIILPEVGGLGQTKLV